MRRGPFFGVGLAEETAEEQAPKTRADEVLDALIYALDKHARALNVAPDPRSLSLLVSFDRTGRPGRVVVHLDAEVRLPGKVSV